jgi:hypothetical protein
LPHALPTGSFGRREVQLFVEWPGGAAEHAFASRPGHALAAGESRRLVVPLPATAASQPVTVTLRRFAPRTDSWEPLVTAEAPAP